MFSSGVMEQYKSFPVELWNSINVFQWSCGTVKMFSSGVVERYKCFLVQLWNIIDVFQWSCGTV